MMSVSLAYAVLTFLMTLPFSLSPGSTVVADLPDTHLFIWTLAWDTHAFLSQPLNIFDANIYYPYANTLAYSENLIGSAFFAAPVIWLTGNLVLAMNLVALLTCVLCGVGGYLLARRLHISVAGAFICGLLFAFASPRFIRLGQLHMTAVQWIPFSLAFLHTYFEQGKRRDLLWATAFFSLQALSSGHGATYLFVSTVALILWHIVFGDGLQLKKRFRDFGATGAYLIAPAVWILLPYQVAQSEAGLRRGYLSNVLPGLESFLASPSQLHQYLQATFLGPPAKEADAYLFPGILILVLAAIAIIGWPRHRRLRDNATAFYLVITIVSTLMFVNWPIEFWRYVYWLPGFNFIRVPSRFIILVMLALSVLAALGFDRLFARASSRTRSVALVVLSTLMLAEYSSYPFPAVPYSVDVPAIDRWLDTQPKPFVIAEVPVPSAGNLGALERQQTTAMLHSSAHWQKTVHGYSGIRRPFHDLLYAELNEFPDEVSLNSLRAVGVNYIVVHTDTYGEGWPAIEARIARTPELKLEHVEGAGRAYSLVPK